MLLSDTSIKRPVFATVIGLLLIAIGAVWLLVMVPALVTIGTHMAERFL